MAGYDGLALSLYDKNSVAFVDKGAQTIFQIDIDDSSTTTAGHRGIDVDLKLTGTHSGFDVCDLRTLSLYGTSHANAAGAYYYICGSATAITGLVAGVYIDIQDMAVAPAGVLTGLRIDRSVTNQGAGGDSFINCVNQGSGITEALIDCDGNEMPYLAFDFLNGNGCAMTAAAPTSTTVVGGIRIKIAGTYYWMLISAGSS